jgi:hypothetical protein
MLKTGRNTKLGEWKTFSLLAGYANLLEKYKLLGPQITIDDWKL